MKDSENISVISVIIVNWNSGCMLRKCLLALNEQSLSADEIIVVDNNSQTDKITSFEEEFPNVSFYFKNQNTGFAAANNFAIRKAKAKWVSLLNPDAFVAKDWLKILYQATKKYPNYASFGSRLINANKPELLDGTGDVYHFSGVAWRRDEACQADGRRLEDSDIFSPCAAAALYLRDAVLEVGCFDEQYFCYFEDVDLGFRLQLAAYPSRYIASAKVYHIGSATTAKQSNFSVYHGHRNLVWTFFKNMPLGLLMIFLPFHLLMTIISPFKFLKNKQFLLLFQAKIDAFVALLRVLKKRFNKPVKQRISALKLVKIINLQL